MKKVRYGILSTAEIARNAHIPASKSTSNSEITAISSRGIEKAQKWAVEHGIAKAYGTYEALLADPEIDAVINPLPVNMHAEWTIKAAEAGKHVLCEKPFALSAAEAAKMAEAAVKNNVLVMEAFTHRFKPEVIFIRDLIASGKLGDVKTIYSDLVYPLGGGWSDSIRAQKELGGGSLLDCGCYCVSLIRYVLEKEPSQVQGFRVLRMPNDVEGTFGGSLLFPEGAIATFFASMELPFRCGLDITLEKGRITLDNFFTGNTVTYVINGEKKEKVFEGRDRFALQMEHFSDCILNGVNLLFTPEDAVKNTLVLDALRKASESGVTVNL